MRSFWKFRSGIDRFGFFVVWTLASVSCESRDHECMKWYYELNYTTVRGGSSADVTTYCDTIAFYTTWSCKEWIGMFYELVCSRTEERRRGNVFNYLS